MSGAVLACLNCGGPPRLTAATLRHDASVRPFWACSCGYLIRMFASPEEGMALREQFAE